MATNIKYRQSSTAPLPSGTTTKGAPLTSLEIDGNFRSLKESIEGESSRIDDIILNGIGSILARHTAVATSGQTVFNLPFTYSPGANNLVVFVDGLIVERNTDYSETSGTVVTFLSGLAVGQEVTFLTNVSPAPEVLWSPAGLSSYVFTADGVQTTWTLPVSVLNKENTQIYVNGVYQEKSGYTISGTNLIFSEAPAAGNFEVVVMSALALGETTATQVSYTPAGTGAVATTVQTKLRETVSVRDFGAIGDGVADDTAAIQAALSVGGNIYIPDGTYIVTPLQMVSDTTLTFSSEAVLQAKTGYGASDRLLNLIGISNVTIHGNFATIQMLKAEYTTGDNRHCVNMYGVSNVTIYDLITKDSGGDGFYVGNVVCRNVNLINCVADNHWRNGLSITNVIGINVIGGEYKNTNGYSFGPCAGIDIESNLLDDYYLQNINISGVYTSGNVGCGILVTPQSKFAPVSINIENCTSVNDGSVAQGRGGIGVNAAMAYTSSTSASLIGKIDGVINIVDCSIINPACQGFSSTNWTENAPTTNVKNLYILNPYSGGGAGAANRQKAGMLIRGETPSSGNYGSSVGNIIFDGVKIEDTRATKLMFIPVYLEPADEATKPLKYIDLKGLSVTPGQWTYGSVFPVLRTGSLAMTNVSVAYDGEFIVDQTSQTLDGSKIGVTFATVTSSNFTLPTAANFIGSTFRFRHRNAGNFQITPQSGDVISHYSLGAGGGLIARSVGSILAVKATAAGIWNVVEEAGGWAIRTGYEPRYPMTFDTAAPTTGTWARGDIIWNLNTSSAGYIGWTCVSSSDSTTGSITSGTTALTVASGSGINNGDTIAIAGAGVAGATLTTTVSSGGGTTSLTLAAAASTTVSDAAVTTPGTWKTFGLVS
jgi:Pectate lyase superfamily protein